MLPQIVCEMSVINASITQIAPHKKEQVIGWENDLKVSS